MKKARSRETAGFGNLVIGAIDKQAVTLIDARFLEVVFKKYQQKYQQKEMCTLCRVF